MQAAKASTAAVQRLLDALAQSWQAGQFGAFAEAEGEAKATALQAARMGWQAQYTWGTRRSQVS